ncbi:MAG: flagellar hook protein FlgE, partial [Chloroflexota bacterium]
MNSAISGLKSHQVFMDTIGNNIANVNTTGFKASRTTFQTMLSQTLRAAVAPTADRGGINPAQVGLGGVVASIDVINTQGTLTTTSKLTDLAIQGDGMFVVTDGFKKYYTRDGAFDVGADSTLVSPTTGLKVLGWNAATDAAGNVTINNALPPTEAITIPTGKSVTSRPSSALIFNGNLNGAATDRLGSGVVESSTNDGIVGFDIAATDTITFTYNGQTFTTDPLAAATTGASGTDLATVAADVETKINDALIAGGVIASAAEGVAVAAVDDAGSVTGEGVLTFQAPEALRFGNSASSNTSLNAALRNRASEGLVTMSTSMVVYDSLGNGHDITVRFEKVTTDETGAAADDTWTWTLANLPPGTSIDTTAGNGEGTGYIKFDTSGKFLSVNTVTGSSTPITVDKASAATLRLDYSNGAASDQDITLDFSTLTQLQSGNTATVSENDGYAAGTLVSFVVGQDGVITGSYSNGVNQALGQIALATFPNVAGLTHVSQNLFVDSANSGIASVGAPGEGGRGQINAGQLEMSNVD